MDNETQIKLGYSARLGGMVFRVIRKGALIEEGLIDGPSDVSDIQRRYVGAECEIEISEAEEKDWIHAQANILDFVLW